MGLEFGQLKLHPQTVSKGSWKSEGQAFPISPVCWRIGAPPSGSLCSIMHAVLLFPDHGLPADAPLLSCTGGKGAGTVQSLFPWFCLCFQRAFKSFEDVWRLWEVRSPWTEVLGTTPPAYAAGNRFPCLPFITGSGALTAPATLLPPCWRS